MLRKSSDKFSMAERHTLFLSTRFIIFITKSNRIIINGLYPTIANGDFD